MVCAGGIFWDGHPGHGMEMLLALSDSIWPRVVLVLVLVVGITNTPLPGGHQQHHHRRH